MIANIHWATITSLRERIADCPPGGTIVNLTQVPAGCGAHTTFYLALSGLPDSPNATARPFPLPNFQTITAEASQQLLDVVREMGYAFDATESK